MAAIIDWEGPWPPVTLSDGSKVTHTVEPNGVMQCANLPGNIPFEPEQVVSYIHEIWVWSETADPCPAVLDVTYSVRIQVPLRNINVTFEMGEW